MNKNPVTFQAGEVIFREGDSEKYAYIILSGLVDICIETNDGPKTIATLGENNLLGEMALIDGEPRSATAIATEEVTCYEIKKHHMDRVFGKTSSVTRTMFQIQNQRIRKANMQVSESA